MYVVVDANKINTNHIFFQERINNTFIENSKFIRIIYSNELFTYTLFGGGTATQPRFKFNGTIDTNARIMNNFFIIISLLYI